MTTQQPISTTPLSSKLDELIEDANAINKTVNSKIYVLLAKCMNIYESEFKNANEIDFSRKVTELKKKLDTKKIRYLEKSPPLNLLVRLISGENTKAGSAHAHVMEVAMIKGISSEQFPEWVSENNGIESIRKNFSRDGKSKESTYPPKRRVLDNTKTHEEYARRQLQGTCLFQFTEMDLTERPGTPVVETEYAAVLIHYPDGTIELKAVAANPSAVTQVLVTVAEREGWAQISEQAHEKEMLRGLLKESHLKLTDIRAINEELAEECSEHWKKTKVFDDDLTNPPADFDLYRTLLRKGDMCRNNQPDSGEHHFERALEELAQLLESNPGLSMYLDRPWTSDISPFAEEMPRFKTRVSKHVNAAGGNYRTKKQTVFRQVVQARIEDLSKHKPRITASEVAARMAITRRLASTHAAVMTN